MAQNSMASRGSQISKKTSHSALMGSREHKPSGPTAPMLPISCNHCRRPLTTTLFVCACDCVFCEDCTYNHFNSSSNCPSCNRVLSEKDFMELVVADPSASSASTKASHFQTLFTKQNSSNRALPLPDVCSRILTQVDDYRAATKFLLKQLLLEVSKQGRRSHQLMRAFEGLKQENTDLKQTNNSQRVRYEKAIEALQQQLASTNKKIHEKDRQLHDFRRLHNQMTPSRGTNNDGANYRRVSSASSIHSPPTERPPMKAFMIQREIQERARQRALDSSQIRTPLFGDEAGRPNSYATPLGTTVYLRTNSCDSNGSISGSIQNLASTSGYAFASGRKENKRRRIMSPSEGVHRLLSPSQGMPIAASRSYGVVNGSCHSNNRQQHSKRSSLRR